MSEKEIIESHESYAVMGFSRGTYGGTEKGVPLFGSSILHRHTITLTIRRAQLKRDLNHDWHHGREHLIEVELSAGQFAEAITTLNCGEGVPCTLRWFDGKHLEGPPYRDRRELIRNEFSERTEDAVTDLRETLANVERVFSEGTIKKADKEKIIRDLKMAIQEVTKNMPYVADCFEKTVSDTVVEAKQEIESFMDHAIRTAGIASLQSGARPIEMLEESTEVKQ